MPVTQARPKSEMERTGNLNLNTVLDGHGGLKGEKREVSSRGKKTEPWRGEYGKKKTNDLLDNFSGGSQVDQTLVDLHFEVIPSLGSFSTRSLTSGDPENFGGHTNGAFDTEVLVLGSGDEIGTD